MKRGTHHFSSSGFQWVLDALNLTLAIVSPKEESMELEDNEAATIAS